MKYKVKCEGSYITFIGDGKKEFTNYEFEKEIPYCNELWVLSMLKARFVPLWVATEKKGPHLVYKKPFDEVHICRVVELEKINGDDILVGKDLAKISTEEEIQAAACKYCLIETPLPFARPIREAREALLMCYLDKILEVPMKTEEEKNALSFMKKNSLGEWHLDLGQEKLIAIDYEQKEFTLDEPVVKKGIGDFLNKKELTEKDLLEI